MTKDFGFLSSVFTWSHSLLSIFLPLALYVLFEAGHLCSHNKWKSRSHLGSCIVWKASIALLLGKHLHPVFASWVYWVEKALPSLWWRCPDWLFRNWLSLDLDRLMLWSVWLYCSQSTIGDALSLALLHRWFVPFYLLLWFVASYQRVLIASHS